MVTMIILFLQNLILIDSVRLKSYKIIGNILNNKSAYLESLSDLEDYYLKFELKKEIPH